MTHPSDGSRTGPDRNERFDAELAKVRLRTGVAARERRWLLGGAAVAGAGALTVLVAFAVSLRLADSRDVGSMVVLAVFGLTLTVIGVAAWLRFALGRVLRLLVLRLLVEPDRASGD